MVKDHAELKKVCGELNLGELKVKIESEYHKYLESLESIKNEALQWAKQIQEQHEKMLTEKTEGPMPPRTPTLKRPTRKRKLPVKLAEADGKENSIAVGRKARGAAQAANSKFYGQFHVPVKLRRPSTSDEAKKQVVPEKKRVRIASSSMETDDDDAVSVASVAPSVASVAPSVSSVAPSVASDMPKPASPPVKNLRSKGKRAAALGTETSDEEEDQQTRMKTRTRKAQDDNKKPNKKPLKKRKLAKKASDSEETPPPPETTQENDVPTTEPEQSQEDEPVEKSKTPNDQKIKKNAKLLMSREVTIKMEKLSETFIMRQVGQDPETESDVPASGSPTDDEPDKAGPVEEVKAPERRKSSRVKPVPEIKLPNKTPDLQALTPHIAGKVMERVKAVEQSLQKGYPRIQIAMPEAGPTTRLSASKSSKQLLTTSEENTSQDTSPDPFADHSDSETHLSSPSSNLKRKSATTSKKLISASMTNLYMTGTLQKSTVSSDKVSFAKKLFEMSSVMRKRRSKSLDAGTKRESQYRSHCCSSQVKPVLNTGTIGRSRIMAGKNFTTQAMKDHLQVTAQEAERKKEEERHLREEKLNEAAKKKEEMLKNKTEEKRRANEEKRNKVKLMQEQKQKELEAQQRKKEEAARQKEEAARLEKEREEQKKKEKEDKANKMMELKAKRLEKKKIEDAKRAKEEEEEQKKAQAKKALEASKQKLLMMHKALKPIHEIPKPATVTQAMNSTFTKPHEEECKTPKPANPAVSKLAQSNSYQVTPTRDELPPEKPKTENDYGIDEVSEGDSSDDDEKPKKKVPAWAARLKGNPMLDSADYVKLAVRNNMFGTRVFKPTIVDLFGPNARQMTRRSSAVWNTPPNLHHMTLNASMLID